MTTPLTDAEATALLLQSDPFASGVHKLSTLSEAATALASRERVVATFAKGRAAPSLVLVGGDDADC